MTSSRTMDNGRIRKGALQRRPAVRRPKPAPVIQGSGSLPVGARLTSSDTEDERSAVLRRTGSSLDLAPSLLNLYDNLATEAEDSVQPVVRDDDSQRASHVQGIWVTSCSTQRRLLLPCSLVPSGRPASFVEPPTMLPADKETKKRPLSVSSLSSASSTSLPRLQLKRPNLSRDADGDHVSSTSSLSVTSNLSVTSDQRGDMMAGVMESDNGESVDRRRSQGLTSTEGEADLQGESCLVSQDVMPIPSSTTGQTGTPVSPTQTGTHVSPENKPSECEDHEKKGQTSLGGASKMEPIVMTPLHSTLRPVVLSVPESIRRLMRGGAAAAADCGSVSPPLPSSKDSGEKTSPSSLSAGALQSCSSGGGEGEPVTWTPLSPTAMARRKFLSSHFDLPELPHMGLSPHDAAALPDGRPPSTSDCSPLTPQDATSTECSPSSLQVVAAAETFSSDSATPSPVTDGNPTPPPSVETSAMEVDKSVEVKGDTVPCAVEGVAARGEEVGGGARGGSTKGAGNSYVTYVQRVVAEIVDTERVYVDSLQAIIKGYLEPLEKLEGVKVAHDDLVCLFCNIRDIFAFGRVFLADLELCSLDPVAVAECFVKHSKGFVIYTDYCTNYPRAVEVLTRYMQDPQLSEVCKECQKALGHGLPLGAYLLRPVQRILKYHLLLQNILKNFDKNRAGYDTLEKALGQMTDMAHHINEMKRRHEHAVRIQEVQSQLEDYKGEDLTRLGELVAEGLFRLYGSKTTRQVFLFEKGILITKKKEGGMLTCKAFILCSNLMLVEVIPNEPLSFQIIPFDNPRASHTLQARNMDQKLQWCQAIKQLILESFKSIPDNVKNLVMALGRSHDNDAVGKDSFDSPWKHQHLAPEYLEKRRFRRKSGGKGSESSLLKPQKPTNGAKQQTGALKKPSPKAQHKSDSKLLPGGRDRARSLPEMLAKTSLPGIVAPTAFAAGSASRQAVPVAAPKSMATMDDNLTPDPGTKQTNSTDSIQLRGSSFKRAMRMKPVTSQDLTFSVPREVALMVDDSQSKPKSKCESKDSTTGQNDSSPSENGESSDADSDGLHEDSGHSRVGSSKASMYSSMPALNTPPRRSSQQIKSSDATFNKGDFSKSSDSLSGDGGPATTADAIEAKRQYRRRWEVADDGLNKKVPAFHDTYLRRSRENLIRNRAVRIVDGQGAKLTNWGSVDKLSHGSLTDLSHLNEDPWVRNPHSSSKDSAVFPGKSYTLPARSAAVKLRTQSMPVAQNNDWSPKGCSSGNLEGLPSSKENLDWLVYLNRNSNDPDIKTRAGSLSRLIGPVSGASDPKLPNTVKDSNIVSKSNSLCRDTIKRYSLQLSDKEKNFFLDRPRVTSSEQPKTRTSKAGGEDEALRKGPRDAHASSRQQDQVSSDAEQDMEVTATSPPASARHQRSRFSGTTQTTLISSDPATSIPSSASLPVENVAVPQKHSDIPQGLAQKSLPHTSQTDGLSLQEHSMIAEMEKYCETNQPTPAVGKFPFHDNLHPTQQAVSGSEDINIKRLSDVSTISSSSNEDSIVLQQGHGHRDPNLNRLSGVSTISTSSYDSMNSNSSDSLVGTLKNKLTALTHKLGLKHKDDDTQCVSNKDSCASAASGKPPAELQEVLREHALGSSLIGSRMANTAAVGAKGDHGQDEEALSLCKFSSQESTSEPSNIFVVDSGLNPTEVNGIPLEQLNHRTSLHSAASGDQTSHKKAKSLAGSVSCLVQDSGTADMASKHHSSCSSLDSGDSFYERRLSVAFESDIFLNSNPYGKSQRETEEEEDRDRVMYGKSIREVVQYIEEKFKPRQLTPREVRRREPSNLIRQRLQSLHNSTVYRPHLSKRSASEDRGRQRDRTPPPVHSAAQRSSRPESRGNQFMHRAHSGHISRGEACKPQEQSDKAKHEEKTESSVNRPEQYHNDTDNLVIMRGWVRSLITKFQQTK